MTDGKPGQGGGDTRTGQLTPQAERALAEAQQRREQAQDTDDTPAHGKSGQKEIGGPAGPEPTRYGDWERKGIASDF